MSEELRNAMRVVEETEGKIGALPLEVKLSLTLDLAEFFSMMEEDNTVRLHIKNPLTGISAGANIYCI